MEIHSMKLAQALPGETSLILFTEQQDKRGTGYTINMNERGYFEITNNKTGDFFLVFPANIAYCKVLKERKTVGRPKKVE